MPKILVTGGNGFLAAQILIIALKRGYEVVATVRTSEKGVQTKKAIARKVGDKVDNLSFHIVPDMEPENAFDEVLQGNQFVAVLHPAAPVHYRAEDPNEMVGPAIGSTKNILRSVKKYGPTVKRVIMTGTLASVIDMKQGLRPGHAYTDSDWNPITWDEMLSGNPVYAYAGAKKWAEKAAWDFVNEEEPHFELVTFCPPMIFGEVAQYIESANELNASSSALYAVLTGHKNANAPPFGVLWVNVTDLATAHILAIDAPNAGNQRFIACADNPYSKKLIADAFFKHFPTFRNSISMTLADGLDENGFPLQGHYTADNSLSKRSLGLTYQSLEDTMVQFVESVKDLPRS